MGRHWHKRHSNSHRNDRDREVRRCLDGEDSLFRRSRSHRDHMPHKRRRRTTSSSVDEYYVPRKKTITRRPPAVLVPSNLNSSDSDESNDSDKSSRIRESLAIDANDCVLDDSGISVSNSSNNGAGDAPIQYHTKHNIVVADAAVQYNINDMDEEDQELESEGEWQEEDQKVDAATSTDRVMIIHEQEERPFMRTMPAGREETYRMTHKGNDFTLIVCGRWPMPVTEWYDCIQIHESLNVDVSMELIAKLLPYQRAKYLIFMPNHNWVDRRHSTFQFPDLVFNRLKQFQQFALHEYQGEDRPQKMFVLGLPLRTYDAIIKFDLYCRQFRPFYIDSKMALVGFDRPTICDASGSPHDLNNYFATHVLHSAMGVARKAAEEMAKREEEAKNEYRSPLMRR